MFYIQGASKNLMVDTLVIFADCNAGLVHIAFHHLDL